MSGRNLCLSRSRTHIIDTEKHSDDEWEQSKKPVNYYYLIKQQFGPITRVIYHCLMLVIVWSFSIRSCKKSVNIMWLIPLQLLLFIRKVSPETKTITVQFALLCLY